jgi:hypothetical protein
MKQFNNYAHSAYFCIFVVSTTATLKSESAHTPLFETTTDCIVEVQDYSAQMRNRKSKAEEKDWTWSIYMSAVNDLRIFARRNIEQLASRGSNQHINIVVHLDIKDRSGKKITQRFYIEKGKIIQFNDPAYDTHPMDSGDEKTLISFGTWAIENYPARNHALIFWNHGMGPIDPVIGKILNPTELFHFNPLTQKLELDRSIGFLDLVCTNKGVLRGICWDDETGNYLTNQKLDHGLNHLYTHVLGGKKFSIIGFDACCMQSIEIANIVKKYAHIAVGSQEVELGTGWNYARVLEPFEHHTLDKHALAHHIVTQYEQEYATITNDYTQSAIDLTQADNLEKNVHAVSEMLLSAISKQSNNSVVNAIKTSCHKLYCTHFDEPSYKDLGHFYKNLLSNLKSISTPNVQETKLIVCSLEKLLREGLATIDIMVLANVTGRNLQEACGITIYLPHRSIHSSYAQNTFAQTNSWLDLLYTIIHH